MEKESMIYFIKSLIGSGNNPLFIGVKGRNVSKGEYLVMESFHGGPSQQWIFDGMGLIRNVQNTSLVIDIKGQKGPYVILWTPNGGDNQVWSFDEKTQIISSKMGKVLDVKGENNSEGTYVIAWKKHGRLNQRWLLIKHTDDDDDDENNADSSKNDDGYHEKNENWTGGGQSQCLTQEQQFRIRSLPGNDICADCGAKEPAWASTNLGILICIQCSGVHRNMGSHISKVKSLTLDMWKEEEIEMMYNHGNEKVNSTLESVSIEKWPKPTESTDVEYRIDYIHRKYKEGLFLGTNLTGLVNNIDQGDTVNNLSKITNFHETSSESNIEEQSNPMDMSNSPDTIKKQKQMITSTGKKMVMVAFSGLLKINLKKGIRLQSADITGKSDPFFMFASAPQNAQSFEDAYPGQIVKSSVKKSTLNPKWNNAMLTVSLVNPSTDVILIQCWDWNLLSSPDFIGFAKVKLSDYKLEGGADSITIVETLQHVKTGSVEFDMSYVSLQ